MWWIYFNIGAVRATRRITASADPGPMARLSYTYLHLPARRPQVRGFSFCRGWPLRFSISISARSTATPS
jgi:hypothetical protein